MITSAAVFGATQCHHYQQNGFSTPPVTLNVSYSVCHRHQVTHSSIVNQV